MKFSQVSQFAQFADYLVTQEMDTFVGIDQDPAAHSIAGPRLRAAVAQSGAATQLHQHNNNFRSIAPCLVASAYKRAT